MGHRTVNNYLIFFCRCILIYYNNWRVQLSYNYLTKKCFSRSAKKKKKTRLCSKRPFVRTEIIIILTIIFMHLRYVTFLFFFYVIISSMCTRAQLSTDEVLYTTETIVITRTTTGVVSRIKNQRVFPDFRRTR